jgi:pimeloyl-ACP methyl ester carboxylesterase
MRRGVLYGLIALVVILLVAWFAGPRVAMDAAVTFDPVAIGDDPEAYLAQSEGRVPNIVDGLQKEIVWAYPASKARTPLSIVYVHGFSASKGEVRPLPDIVARELGANLFYTRLTGHGQDGPAMATASVKAWANDFAEAVAVGRAIGEEVIVMATSTGGGLTIWAAANQPELMDKVKALVLLSPNVGVRAAGAWVLTMPWGGVLADWMTGGTRGFTPSNELQERYWTASYPTSATLPMAAITTLAAASRVENIHIPALFVISDGDKVVRPEITRKMAARWGAPHDIYVVDNAEDPSQHVIAGDAFSPSATQPAAEKIVEWINALPR